MKVKYHPYDLVLKDKFQTSHGSVEVRESLFIEIESEEIKGIGECVAIHYYHFTRKDFIRLLEMHKDWLCSIPLENLDKTLKRLHTGPIRNNFLLSALDVAIHDWYGKKEQQTISAMYEIQRSNIPLSSLTIGIMPLESIQDYIQNNPWPIYKVKLGGAEDIKVIEKIKSYTDQVLIVDANGGWTPKETLDKSSILHELGVLYIEQPLPKAAEHHLFEIKKHIKIPFFADESCQTIEDIEWCAKLYDGINIKLLKAGGIRPALEMAQYAKQMDLQVMLGCMTESSVGISAAAQLLPLARYADLDGALLIKNDPAMGVTIQVNSPNTGSVVYPSGFGHGAALKSP